MTPRDFCQSGRSEVTKAAVHGALGLLAGTCFLYNVAAWAWRREHHLALNVGLYGLVALVEASQVEHHLANLKRDARPAA